MMLFYEGEKYFLDDFCMLTEALVPKETLYGTPPYCNNGKLDVTSGSITTWFKQDSDIFLVQLDNSGEFGFARHVHDKPFEFAYGNYVMDQSLPMTNSIAVFNKVFFIILKLAEKSGIDVLKFSGSHNRLGVVYDRMMANTSVISKLKDFGWQHSFEELTNPNSRIRSYKHYIRKIK